MQTNTFFLQDLQGQLARAFKWMGKATKCSQEGDFYMAVSDLTTALEYWTRCQHLRDSFIKDSDAEQIDWKFFTTKALAMAKKELQEEYKGE